MWFSLWFLVGSYSPGELLWLDALIVYFVVCVLITRHVFRQGEPGEGKAVSGVHGPDYIAPKPFVRQDNPPNLYELVKTSLMLMVLPVRAALCILWLCIVWSIYHIIVLGADLSKPLKKYQLTAMHYMGRIACTGLLLLFGFWVKVTRVRYERVNEEDGDDSSAGVIVCNHVSYLDIPLCGSIFGSGFIAKAAVKDLPFFGFVSRAQQCCFVSTSARAGKAAAEEKKKPKKSTTELIMERQAEPEKWPPLLMFPEGTTTNGAYMTVFRSGAFVAGKPVQPVSISYPFEHFSLAYESIYGKYHVFRALTQFVNYAHITVLPPYFPSKVEKADPKLYARNVGKLIAEDLGIELTSTTFADKLKYLKFLRGDNEKRLKVD